MVSVGLVGLPNAGKSLIMNIVSGRNVSEVGNYAFCTIKPSKFKVMVKDQRINKVAKYYKSLNSIYPLIEFHDIAGLIEGASEGKGLGNEFLANIQEVDVLMYVIRCFEEKNVVHVNDSIDPLRDIKILNHEIIMKDLEHWKNFTHRNQKKYKNHNLNEVEDYLNNNKSIRQFLEDQEDKEWYSIIKSAPVISYKPIAICANFSNIHSNYEQELVDIVKTYAEFHNYQFIAISGLSEHGYHLINEEDEDSREEGECLLGDYPLYPDGSRVDQLILTVMRASDSEVFFTGGPKEARGWIVSKNSTAAIAAGKIHSDFQQSIICVKLVSFENLMKGESPKRYDRAHIIQDGDICEFIV